MNDHDKLIEYVKQNDLENVKRMIEDEGTDLHTNHDSPIYWASLYGNYEVMKFLIEKGADIHAYKDCALRYACRRGHLEIVRYLVEKGGTACIHTENDDAIHVASWHHHLAVVEFLFENGALLSRIVDITMRRALAKKRLVKFLRNRLLRNKLKELIKILTPIYFHPECKGGYFAKKEINSFLTKVNFGTNLN